MKTGPSQVTLAPGLAVHLASKVFLVCPVAGLVRGILTLNYQVVDQAVVPVREGLPRLSHSLVVPAVLAVPLH